MMGQKGMWMWMVLMFVLSERWQSEGCLDQERFALLQLKHFFNDPYVLQDWVEGEQNSDCCQWEMITCNNTTNRVVELDLSYTRNKKLGEWYLKTSLFSPFGELESLVLRNNLIAGCVENEGFEGLSNLTNLKRLDLFANKFNDSNILSCFGVLQSLNFLDLQYNQFRELNYINDLTLSNLEYLYISNNIFNNSILSSLASLSSLKELHLFNIGLKGTVRIQELESLNNLAALGIGGNEIVKFEFPKGHDENNISLKKLNSLYLHNVSISDGSTLLQSLGSLPSLKTVIVSYCNFSGIDTTHRGVHNLTNVQELDFLGSSLHVSLLPSIAMFTSLGRLVISDCEVNGILADQDFHTLKNLKVLNIFGTTFNNNFGQIIGSMTSLETLSIYNCTIKGTLSDQDFHTLKNLKVLDMVDTAFNNNFGQIIGSMTSLETLSIYNCIIKGTLSDQDSPTFKNLKYLRMFSIEVNNNLCQIIRSMTSLKTLSMFKCNVTGTLFDQGICELLHLQKLNISQNDLGGTLPWCLAKLISLQVLDISSNHFVGKISSSPLKVLTSIQELWLSNNHFQFPISLEPFFNHSKLKHFHGENNKIYAEVGPHSLAPKFQLNSITLSYCKDCGFPKFFYHQHDLQEVNLFQINLKGGFPVWLLENNTKLEKLYLVNNSLSGTFQLPNHSQMHLKDLDISINSFHGHIPIEVGACLPMIEYFNISQNSFNGSIPSSFANMKSLVSLDLSNNLLFGEIPEDLAIGCFSLKLLVLSNNNLRGQIFSTNFNLTKLQWLQLEGNQFTGSIPDSLSNCSLYGLYLSDNYLSGKIPGWLGNMWDLLDIIMPNNQFEGPIPFEFCQLDILEILDLSGNNITGSLPFCLRPSSIRQVHLSKNKLQGQLKEAFSKSSSLMTLDIGYNHFDGKIPEWIGKLSNLAYLILSNNNIQGEVSSQLCKLHQLRLIDLSHNNLSGHIPPCLNINIVSTSDSSSILGFDNIAIKPSMRKEEIVEFTTKRISLFYQGRILKYMSGIDLSCNKLTGVIPYQIGNLVGIHALNLSHNNFVGPIPQIFSNLKQIESLDLSYNNLNGTIPPQLIELNALSIFSVAHNNLSGKTPDRTAQFGTFEVGSYEGNPFLCGQPLPKSCNETELAPSIPKASTDSVEDNDFIDMDIFYISFTTSFIIVVLAIVVVLYINPYWCRTWFYLVEMWMFFCYYFVVDHLM